MPVPDGAHTRRPRGTPGQAAPRWTVLAMVALLAACSGGAPTDPAPVPSDPAPVPSSPAPSSPVPSTPVSSSPPPSAASSAPLDLPAPVTCPTPTVRVSTTDELQQALARAVPGTVVQLADGTYRGSFTATARGTAEAPVFLCGGPGAVLDGGGFEEGYVLHLDGAAYWRVVGITIRNGQKGVMADAAQHVVLQGLTVESTGDEAVHLRRGSSDNVVRDSTVRDTGHRRDTFGEGIYVGTATSNWCSISACEPDASDRNLVLDNTVSATTAESVDLKEGTSDGVVAGNTFDGAALTGADSWLDAKGNDWLVSGNVGAHSPADGFQTHEVAEGWGRRTTFDGNRGSDLAVDDPEGVLIGLHPDRAAVVRCTNEVSDGSAPVTNLSSTACR